MFYSLVAYCLFVVLAWDFFVWEMDIKPPYVMPPDNLPTSGQNALRVWHWQNAPLGSRKDISSSLEPAASKCKRKCWIAHTIFELPGRAACCYSHAAVRLLVCRLNITGSKGMTSRWLHTVETYIVTRGRFQWWCFFHHVSGPFWDASSLRHSYWWWVVRGDSCRWRHVTPQIYISTLRAAAGLDRICWVTFVIIGLCRTQCWGWL